MPYASTADVPSYVPKAKRAQWREIWNSAHAAALKKGKSPKAAEQSAFAQANGVTGHEALMFFETFPVVKEASLPMNTSHDALRGQLHQALKTAHGIEPNSWSADSPWVQSVFPSHVVYSHKGQMHKRSYTVTQGAVGSEPTIKLGDPKLVHTAYVDSKTTESKAVLLEAGVIITPAADDEEEIEEIHESASFDETVRVAESALRAVPVKIIGPGWGSMAYYPKEVLKRDGPKVYIKGTHMMWNHATSSQEAERPEGDLDSLAAVLTKDAEWKDKGPKGPGLYSEAKVFSDYATKVAEKGAHIGVSINAGIRGHEGDAEGRHGKIADALVRAYSVDFVTKAGAGGAPIVPVTEAARAHQGATVMDEKEQEALRKENEELKAKNRTLESGQSEVVAFSTAASVLREAEIPFSEPLLKRACANPVMKEGKPDADWIKGIVKDFSDGYQGKITGAGDGTQTRSRESAKRDETVDKRLKEALTDLGVPKAGIDYAVSGRA